jgi:hypothetical protein
MNQMQDPESQAWIAKARDSFTGKTLTDGQFEESWALAGVMERSIRTSGSFVEKLGDYAHAFARAERFDATRGEVIIRDMFKARYGVTMKQMREGLLKREAEVKDTINEQAIEHARGIEPLIRDGETMPFYRAYDRQAAKMATTFGITQAGAKTMMKDAYEKIEGRDLYETGKALEEKYHLPAREAAKQERETVRQR